MLHKNRGNPCICSSLVEIHPLRQFHFRVSRLWPKDVPNRLLMPMGLWFLGQAKPLRCGLFQGNDTAATHLTCWGCESMWICHKPWQKPRNPCQMKEGLIHPLGLLHGICNHLSCLWTKLDRVRCFVKVHFINLIFSSSFELNLNQYVD